MNKIKNRIVFRIKTYYYRINKLELLSPETIKIITKYKKDIDQDKDGEYVRKLESVEVVLVHFILVYSNYQQSI